LAENGATGQGTASALRARCTAGGARTSQKSDQTIALTTVISSGGRRRRQERKKSGQERKTLRDAVVRLSPVLRALDAVINTATSGEDTPRP